MEYFVKKKIGKEIHTFVVQGKNLFECLIEAQKLSFGNIDKCGLCSNENLILNARIVQYKKTTYQYTEIKCLNHSCRGTLTFGKQKGEEDTFFLRRNDDKSYKWIAYNPNATVEIPDDSE